MEDSDDNNQQREEHDVEKNSDDIGWPWERV